MTPSQEALSAVNSAALALDLLSEHRSTAALTTVVVDDAVDQLASDEQMVVKLHSSTDRQRIDRDAVVVATRQAVTVGLDARDSLALSTSPRGAPDRLQAAGLTSRLQAGQ